jgi:hypothetical protein
LKRRSLCSQRASTVEVLGERIGLVFSVSVGADASDR